MKDLFDIQRRLLLSADFARYKGHRALAGALDQLYEALSDQPHSVESVRDLMSAVCPGAEDEPTPLLAGEIFAANRNLPRVVV